MEREKSHKYRTLLRSMRKGPTTAWVSGLLPTTLEGVEVHLCGGSKATIESQDRDAVARALRTLGPNVRIECHSTRIELPDGDVGRMHEVFSYELGRASDIYRYKDIKVCATQDKYLNVGTVLVSLNGDLEKAKQTVARAIVYGAQH